MSEERRQKRKEIRLLQSESVWLQKALFALRKAEAAREKLADARDAEEESYTLVLDGEERSLEALEDGLEHRIEDLMRTVRTMRNNL